MSELRVRVLRSFKAFCSEMNVSLADHGMAEAIIQDEIQDFERADKSYGVGKTRRPTMNHKYFAEILDRIKEIRRREREDIGYLFGEDGA